MIWILALWCGFKLLGNVPGQPAYAVLLGVLAVSVGAVIHPVSVAAPTDLILVLLAFAAGLRLHRRNGPWLSGWCWAPLWCRFRLWNSID